MQRRSRRPRTPGGETPRTRRDGGHHARMAHVNGRTPPRSGSRTPEAVVRPRRPTRGPGSKPKGPRTRAPRRVAERASGTPRRRPGSGGRSGQGRRRRPGGGGRGPVMFRAAGRTGSCGHGRVRGRGTPRPRCRGLPAHRRPGARHGTVSVEGAVRHSSAGAGAGTVADRPRAGAGGCARVGSARGANLPAPSGSVGSGARRTPVTPRGPTLTSLRTPLRSVLDDRRPGLDPQRPGSLSRCRPRPSPAPWCRRGARPSPFAAKPAAEPQARPAPAATAFAQR
ncbi:PE-PGRS family protein [Streptomyces sp. ACT-1]|nr:PE-PGRS family protein [Streptomyces sp. ACT-1]